MKLSRSLGILFASTAFVSMASTAFALDGNALVTKINGVLDNSGAKVAVTSATVDGDTVTLEGVTFTPAMPNAKPVPVGKVVMDGVTQNEDGGYVIEKTTFDDVNYSQDGATISASDIYLEGLKIPADPKAASIESMMPADSFHAGAVKISNQGKVVAGVEEINANYTLADDKSSVDFDADISGINVDLSSVPDPKSQQAVQALGLQQLKGEITMKGSWTIADGKLNLDEYALDFDNIGRLDMNFSLSGYTLDFVKGLQQAAKAAEANPDKTAAQQALGMSMMGLVQQLTYNGASIRFDDAGITSKILDFAGKQQGVDGKQFAQSIKGMLPMMLGQLNMPDLQDKIVKAASAFLDDPKSISVTAVPDQPMPAPQIMGTAMSNPKDLVNTLNVQIIAND